MGVRTKKQWALGEALARAEDLKIKPWDVKVMRIPPRECLWDGCEKEATCYISIDIRNAGFCATIGERYCPTHALAMAKRIKEAL